MIRLASSSFMGVLILEGTGKELVGIGMGREAMQGALINVSLILGIPVLRAKDSAETLWNCESPPFLFLNTITYTLLCQPQYQTSPEESKSSHILSGLRDLYFLSLET